MENGKNKEVFYTHSAAEGGATIVAVAIRGTMEKIFGEMIGATLFDDEPMPPPTSDGAIFRITIERMEE